MFQQDTTQPEQKAEVATEVVEENAAEGSPEFIDEKSLIQNNMETKTNGDKAVTSAVTKTKNLEELIQKK